MGREKKPPTESVRVSVHIMDGVREKSKQTGLSLIRLVEHAIQNDLMQKPTQEK